MVIDTLTIVVCCCLVAMAVVSSLCNGFLLSRKQRPKGIRGTSDYPPRFSIVIAAHDKAAALERNLPCFLTQDYAPGYEVIVVDESSTDDTEDVLKRLKTKYQHLYTTFIPESSHYLSRRKLALTVGVKAAKNEWIIFTDADCVPDSENWLKTMSGYCGDNVDMAIGYTNYSHDTKSFYRFERLLTYCYIMCSKPPYRYNGNNLALRKSVFMRHNGFLKNLKYLRGEYEFMVNEYAVADHVAIVPDADAFVRQDKPSRKVWLNTGLYYIETRRHLSRSMRFRMLPNTATLLLYLNYLIEIAALSYSIVFHNIVTMIAAIAAFIITLVVRIFIARKTIAMYGEKIAVIKIPFFELRMMWHNLWLLFKHRMADKYDFIRK